MSGRAGTRSADSSPSKEWKLNCEQLVPTLLVEMGPGLVERCEESHASGIRSQLAARCGSIWQILFRAALKAKRWAWPLTIAVAIIYMACFASFIKRHTSLPFWDGNIYVQETLDLAKKLHRTSFFQRLNPALYFHGAFPERPPLLIAIAAIVLGPNPGNASIAYVWLIVRVVVIFLALYLLSREFGTARFVPAAALVIFASPLMCNFYRLYFMDEPFAAFGLLAFGLLLIDDRRQTAGSALAASAGILALFLIKPVAPAFVLPMCLIRGARALLPVRHDWPNIKQHARGLMLWGIPYLLLLIIMLALIYGTPYGSGIRTLYTLGMTGYWQEDINAGAAWKLISFVLPPWLLLTLLVALPFSRRFQQKAVLLYLVGGLLWWFLFSFFLTFNVEDRLLGQAMPYLVTALLIWICQRPKLTLAVTLAATFFFAYNTLAANGIITPRYRRANVKLIRFLSPIPRYQKPVPEVGLLALARPLDDAVGNSDSPRVCCVFGDIYVTPDSLDMAMRISKPLSRVRLRSLRSDPPGLDLARVFQTRWFITKTRRQSIGHSGTGLWTTINCVHALITDSESPLRPYFHKVLEGSVHQPDIEDSLVLWHIPSAPPAATVAESLQWLKPRLTNDPPKFKAVIDSQLRALSPSTSEAGPVP